MLDREGGESVDREVVAAASSEQALDPLNHRLTSSRALNGDEEGVVTGDRAEDA